MSERRTRRLFLAGTAITAVSGAVLIADTFYGAVAEKSIVAQQVHPPTAPELSRATLCLNSPIPLVNREQTCAESADIYRRQSLYNRALAEYNSIQVKKAIVAFGLIATSTICYIRSLRGLIRYT